MGLNRISSRQIISGEEIHYLIFTESNYYNEKVIYILLQNKLCRITLPRPSMTKKTIDIEVVAGIFIKVYR